MGKREFWGVDLETSGTSHERHVPIQLGIGAPNGDYASWLINGWQWADDCDGIVGETCWLWDLRAAEIHGLTKEQIDRHGSSPYDVTLQAVEFIERNSKAWHGERKVVGWNVGSFDMPYLRKHMYGVARKLSYQSADLNAVTFAISEAQGISSKHLKRQAQEAGAAGAYALTGLGVDEGLHDAGWDAVAALGAWDYLKSRIREGY